ncbi:MAG: sorbosone dehydrogenase family protein [Rhodanobacteraceae bacterium]|nr:MAG: sorbosone dehydrogenase family protein [Rhodanobacteraceae bacterium]
MARSGCVAAVLASLLAGLAGAACAAVPLQRLHVPPGFQVALYSDQVPTARELALGAHGTVFVGSFGAGKVYALTGMTAAGRAGHVYVIARDLEMPVGVAFHDGALYVSAVSRILKYPDIEQHLADPPQPVVVTDKLPAKTHHGWRFIAFGPDGKLYVPIGAPCNICAPGPAFAKIIRMDSDGTHWQTVATGIRNTVGFDWQPGSHALWFTNNGRDLMGDDIPADTLNRVDRPGENFGYPYCHAGNVLDPEFGHGHSCSQFAQPALRLGAHVAALGMRFYVGQMFPAAYHDAIFIAEHGSWNRSRKAGYQVRVVHVGKDGTVLSSAPFLTGFLEGQKTLGRPVDVQPLRDGSLLVSDDYNGAVYRITYTPAGGAGVGPAAGHAHTPAPSRRARP